MGAGRTLACRWEAMRAAGSWRLEWASCEGFAMESSRARSASVPSIHTRRTHALSSCPTQTHPAPPRPSHAVYHPVAVRPDLYCQGRAQHGPRHDGAPAAPAALRREGFLAAGGWRPGRGPVAAAPRSQAALHPAPPLPTSPLHPPPTLCQIAKHVLDVHRLAGGQPEADEDEKRVRGRAPACMPPSPCTQRGCAASRVRSLLPAHVLRIRYPTPMVPQEEAFLKRYIEYCRQACSPRIADSAAKLLANEYVELRAEVRQGAGGVGTCGKARGAGYRGLAGWPAAAPHPAAPCHHPPTRTPPTPPRPPPQSKRAASADGSDIPAIPVTVRQLEAVIRIAESLAKMNLQVGGWLCGARV